MQQMQIAAGREQTAVFKFRVADHLGSGEINFTASAGGARVHRRATLSIRPPVPYMTDVRSGSFTDSSTDVSIDRALRPDSRQLEASISALPLGLAHGLDVYLKNFPHGCSEQITSAAFCRLLLSDEVDFGLKRAEISAQLEKTFTTLRRRQNDQGGFGYWAPETVAHISFVSVYVMDFLSQAKAAGVPPPSEMFTTGLRNLQTIAGREPSTFADARTVAYAIGTQLGIIGNTWGVEWCVVGIDPTLAYAPDCEAIRPILEREIGKAKWLAGYGVKARY